MQINSSHWLKALTLAIAVHAVALIGLRSRTPGEASPAAGPIIELATAIPGTAGTVSDDDATHPPDKVEKKEEADKAEVKEQIKPEPIQAEPTKAEPDSARPEPQQAEPVSTKPAPPIAEPVSAMPIAPLVEPEKTEPAKTGPVRIKREPETLKKKTKPKRAAVKKKKKRPKTAHKKRKKRAVASRHGNARKGAAGAQKGGSGRSKASAGAINRYASLVRARILARRPSASGNRGTTVISFQLSASGGLRWARIRRSSGNGNLDRKALGSVRRAAPFPNPPSGMRGRQLRFSIPFRFR